MGTGTSVTRTDPVTPTRIREKPLRSAHDILDIVQNRVFVPSSSASKCLNFVSNVASYKAKPRYS